MPSLLIRRRFVLSRTHLFLRSLLRIDQNTAPTRSPLPRPLPPLTPLTAPITTALPLLVDDTYDSDGDEGPFSTYTDEDEWYTDTDEETDGPPGLITDDDDDDYEEDWDESQLAFIAYWYSQLTIAALTSLIYVINLLISAALQQSCHPSPPPPPPPSWYH